MEPNFNIKNLPNEIITQILEFSKEPSVIVDKKMNELALQFFYDKNSQIAKLYPPLAEVVTIEKNNISPIKLFIQLVNILHEEAERLDCNIEAPKEEQEKLKWEWNHYQTLINKIKEKTESQQVDDFKKFVDAVLISIIDEDLIQDDEISIDTSDPSYYEKVWEFLTTNKADELAQIKRLDLSSKELKFLPSEIKFLKGLQILNLKNNSLKTIPEEIKNLLELTNINLKKNPYIASNFLKLPPEAISLILNFSKETSASVNKVTHAHITNIFKETNLEIAKSYPSLEKFFIENSDSMHPAQLFMRLVNILHEEAKRLDCDIKGPENEDEEKLNWEWNHYHILIQNIQQATEIVKVENFESFVTTVIDEVIRRKLISQEEIKIDQNDPDYYRKVWNFLMKHKKEPLSQITSLTLSSRDHFCFLPPEIGELKGLKALVLEFNDLVELPDTILNLKDLGSIDISNNRFKDIPDVIYQLTSLQILTINNNEITSLKPDIKNLQNLKMLGLNHNQLTSIPAELFAIQGLEELWLPENKLKDIPHEIGNLKNLKTLVIADNQISSLPKEIGQLNLDTFLFMGNSIVDLPDEMHNKQLFLIANTMSNQKNEDNENPSFWFKR